MRMEYEFCALILFRGKLYVGREEKVGGPRRLLLPPKEVPTDSDAITLGNELLAALADYRDAGHPMYADEWQRAERQLLDFFGASSVASFERKKRDVTVRRHVPAREIHLSGATDDWTVVPDEDPLRLGLAAKELLGI